MSKEKCYTVDDGSGEPCGILGARGVADHILATLEDADVLSDGESITFEVARHDMTREEIEALPEV